MASILFLCIVIQLPFLYHFNLKAALNIKPEYKWGAYSLLWSSDKFQNSNGIKYRNLGRISAIILILSPFIVMGIAKIMYPYSGKWLNKQITTYGSDSSVVDIREYTVFEWDTLYVFSEDFSLDEIKKMFHSDFRTDSLYAQKVVFIESGELVHYEELDFRYDENDSIYKLLYFPNVEAYIKYSKEDSKFLLTKENFEGDIYYSLEPYK